MGKAVPKGRASSLRKRGYTLHDEVQELAPGGNMEAHVTLSPYSCALLRNWPLSKHNILFRPQMAWKEFSEDEPGWDLCYCLLWDDRLSTGEGQTTYGIYIIADTGGDKTAVFISTH